jgi:hypothetical protein
VFIDGREVGRHRERCGSGPAGIACVRRIPRSGRASASSRSGPGSGRSGTRPSGGERPGSFLRNGKARSPPSSCRRDSRVFRS